MISYRKWHDPSTVCKFFKKGLEQVWQQGTWWDDDFLFFFSPIKSTHNFMQIIIVFFCLFFFQFWHNLVFCKFHFFKYKNNVWCCLFFTGRRCGESSVEFLPVVVVVVVGLRRLQFGIQLAALHLLSSAPVRGFDEVKTTMMKMTKFRCASVWCWPRCRCCWTQRILDQWARPNQLSARRPSATHRKWMGDDRLVSLQHIHFRIVCWKSLLSLLGGGHWPAILVV